MSQTQSTFKTLTDAQTENDDTVETPEVRRSDVVGVIPLPEISQVDAWAEWCDLSDAVADSVVAAIEEAH